MQENLIINQKELKIRPFKIPIYDWVVVLLIGEQEAAERLISDKEFVRISDYGHFLGSTFQPDTTVYIWYPEDATLTTKCHEILHATFHVLSSVGVDIEDQEAVCYLFEYILQKCLDLEVE